MESLPKFLLSASSPSSSPYLFAQLPSAQSSNSISPTCLSRRLFTCVGNREYDKMGSYINHPHRQTGKSTQFDDYFAGPPDSASFQKIIPRSGHCVSKHPFSPKISKHGHWKGRRRHHHARFAIRGEHGRGRGRRPEAPRPSGSARPSSTLQNSGTLQSHRLHGLKENHSASLSFSFITCKRQKTPTSSLVGKEQGAEAYGRSGTRRRLQTVVEKLRYRKLAWLGWCRHDCFSPRNTVLNPAIQSLSTEYSLGSPCVTQKTLLTNVNPSCVPPWTGFSFPRRTREF